MAQCEHCKAHCIWRGSSYFPEHGCLVGYVPITNADRIRAMTDEELATWLYMHRWNDLESILEWLKKEASDG